MKSKSKKPSKRQFTTIHKLDFLTCLWERDHEWNRFKIGTCDGLWRATFVTYDILVVNNELPGNGHFEDVFQWFENSCRRDGKMLRIMEVWNKRLKRHLIEKRGFECIGEHCVKTFI